MSGFTFNFTFSDNSYIEIVSSDSVKYWEGEGLHDFEGSLDTFGDVYPEHLEMLVKRGPVFKKN